MIYPIGAIRHYEELTGVEEVFVNSPGPLAAFGEHTFHPLVRKLRIARHMLQPQVPIWCQEHPYYLTDGWDPPSMGFMFRNIFLCIAFTSRAVRYRVRFDRKLNISKR